MAAIKTLMDEFMRLKPLAISAVILTAMSLFTASSYACVDSTSYTVSSNINTSPPDFPLNPYVSGRLGIINPEFGITYLLTAYRYLNNQPLTSDEQNSLLEFWNWYFLNMTYANVNLNPQLIDFLARYILSAKSQDYSPTIVIDQRLRDAQATPNFSAVQQQLIPRYQDYIAWRQARLNALQQKDTAPALDLSASKNIADAINKIDTYYSDLASKEDQLSLDNIQQVDGENILQFATQRLKQLTAQIHDPAIINAWIKTQQAIFKHLDDIALTPYGSDDTDSAKANDISAINQAIAAFPAQLPLLAQNEKAYFQAAANFYTRDPKLLLQAAQQFTDLANNQQYPWHEWSAYLAQRAHALAIFTEQSQQIKNSQGSNPFAYSTQQSQDLQQIRSNMLQLANKTTDSNIKRAANQYAEIINSRLQPNLWSDQVNATNTTVNAKNLKDLFFLDSYGLHSNYSSEDEEQDRNNPLPDSVNKIITANSNQPTASDWITLYQISTNLNYDRAAVFNYAYRLWQQQANNGAWLLIATNAIKYANPTQRENIIKAINSLSASHPGYMSLYAALLQQDDQQHFLDTAARKQLIDAALTHLTDNDDFRSKIFFLTERANSTDSINDLLTHATYQPSSRLAAIYPPFVDNQPAYYFLTAYNDLINQLPLNVLLDVANSKLLPQNFRNNLLANIWVRSVLLNNQALENKVTSQLIPLIPDLAPYLKARQTSNSNDERLTQFVSALLHLPYLSPQIDLTQADTWNADSNAVSNINNSLPLILKAGVFNQHDNYLWSKMDAKNSADFLTTQQKTAYQQESNQLAMFPAGANWVTAQVIALAKRHPDDQRYAELLALAIKATHYAPQSRSGDSKKAFLLLKKLYPDSQWAKETKYYY